MMNVSNNIKVKEWNNEITSQLIPNLAIMSIYFPVGVCGNGLVIAVYSTRMKKSTDERYCIPILAVLDLITAVYCSVFGLIQNIYYVTFTHDILCKITHFFVGFTTFMPILLLLIIAIQRYMKVCKPLKPPMTNSFKRGLLILTVVLAFFIALPLPFAYGTSPFQSHQYGLTGARCGKLKDGHKLERAAYGICMGLFAISTITTLIVLYGKIGCMAHRHFKNGKTREKFERGKVKSLSDVELTSNNKEISVVFNDEATASTNKTEDTLSNINIEYQNNLCSKTNTIAWSSEQPCTVLSRFEIRNRTNRRITNKLTAMFTLITFVFVLSYIPKIVILILEGIYSDFWERLSDSQRPGIVFIYRVLNIVNPLIYAFMDIKFRNETRNFFKRLCNCTSKLPP